jgi:transcription elongation factor Elf1
MTPDPSIAILVAAKQTRSETMTEKIPVSFRCKSCGTKLTWSDDAVDSTEITCKNCGTRFGTYADLRHTAVETVKEKVTALFKDAFKRR